jgi:hypothetical protein
MPGSMQGLAGHHVEGGACEKSGNSQDVGHGDPLGMLSSQHCFTVYRLGSFSNKAGLSLAIKCQLVVVVLCAAAILPCCVLQVW